MSFSNHCALCENEIKSLDNGLTCKLTEKKPDFKKKCPDILLEGKFQEKLEDVYFELEEVGKSKKRVYLFIGFLFIIGLIDIVGSILYADFLQHSNYRWVYRVGAIGTGFTVLIAVWYVLNDFKNKLRAAEFEIHKIDSTLKEYGISYRTNFDYGERIHGNQNIEITIEYENWTKKRTTTEFVVRQY